MKLRTGFVSNSSSMSFVVVGFHVNGYEIEDSLFDELHEREDFAYLRGARDGLSDGDEFMGIFLKKVRGTHIPDYNQKEVEDIEPQVEELRKKIGIKSTVSVVKTGRRFESP